MVMGPWDFEVYRDNKLAAKNAYGQPAEFSKP
jgi:hypothetical protein